MPSHVGTIHPEAGVKGWDVTQSVWEARQEIQSFVVSGDVAIGEWVQLAIGSAGGVTQTINTVKKAVKVTTVGCSLVVGVAIEAGKVGEVIKVCTAGLCAKALVTSGIAADVVLAVITTDGTGSTATAGATSIVGTTLAAESGGYAPVLVLKKI